MSAWASPDGHLAITDGAARKVAQSEDRISEIVNALAVSGQYVAHLDLEPAQRLVDFKWAARQAGRRLGMRVDIHQTISKASDQTLVQVTGVRACL
jgi:N-acyl-D-aspartate/D-glutamate deacylase